MFVVLKEEFSLLLALMRRQKVHQIMGKPIIMLRQICIPHVNMKGLQ
jgi:hypothetical protein